MKIPQVMSFIVATAVLAGCTSAPSNNSTTVTQPAQTQMPTQIQAPAQSQMPTQIQAPAQSQMPTQPDKAPTGTALPAGAYPTDTRTGIAEVDRVIDAVLKQDANTLTGLVKMTPTACRTQTTVGDLPCSPGVADGTVIPAFGWSSSFAPQHTIELASAQKFVVETLTTRPTYLYAVSRTGSNVGPAYEVYVDDNPSDIYARIIGLDRHGAIVRLDTGGKVTAGQESWSHLDVVLPPRK